MGDENNPQERREEVFPEHLLVTIPALFRIYYEYDQLLHGMANFHTFFLCSC